MKSYLKVKKHKKLFKSKKQNKKTIRACVKFTLKIWIKLQYINQFLNIFSVFMLNFSLLDSDPDPQPCQEYCRIRSADNDSRPLIPGEKPFGCPACGKHFHRAANLAIHTRSVHNTVKVGYAWSLGDFFGHKCSNHNWTLG